MSTPSITSEEWQALDYLRRVGGTSTNGLLKQYGHAGELASLKSKKLVKRSRSAWSITALGRKAINK